MTSPGRRLWAIVPAAGRGERFGGALPKQYSPLLGASVIEHALAPLLAEPRVHAVIVVIAAADSYWAALQARVGNPKLQSTVGGMQRQDTVLNGLEFLATRAAPADWVLVHDAARPCFSSTDLTQLIDALPVDDSAVGAVLAAPVVDTVKRESEGRVSTLDRSGLWRALTPQVFRYDILRRALGEARTAGIAVTDESQAVERLGLVVRLVPGSPFNIKVTRNEDLAQAARILNMTEGSNFRVGQGMDVHAFGAGDHVVLGGVRIAYTQGIVAHSDGDVVIHALCDAILGALGDGDIGQHFPDTDPRYRGADSRVFLKVVAQRMHDAGFKLVNADVTVLAEAPRIGAHRAAMASNLAADLQVKPQQINVKATTTEKLGFIGRQEGLAALVSVLLGP